MLGAATELVAAIHSIEWQNSLQPEFDSQCMQENENLNNGSIFRSLQAFLDSSPPKSIASGFRKQTPAPLVYTLDRFL